LAAGARTKDLRPYLLHKTKHGGEGEDARLEVFMAAHQAARKCNVEPHSFCLRHRSGASLTASRSTCPNGHMLKPRGATAASCGIIPCVAKNPGQMECSVCRCTLGPRQWRASCIPCRYAVCQGCWEHTASSALHGREQLQLASGTAAPCCPSGHAMERMVGQQVRGDCACSLCGRNSLGATCPFFLSCRICAYDLCHHCARKGTADGRA